PGAAPSGPPGRRGNPPIESAPPEANRHRVPRCDLSGPAHDFARWAEADGVAAGEAGERTEGVEPAGQRLRRLAAPARLRAGGPGEPALQVRDRPAGVAQERRQEPGPESPATPDQLLPGVGMAAARDL